MAGFVYSIDFDHVGAFDTGYLVQQTFVLKLDAAERHALDYGTLLGGGEPDRSPSPWTPEVAPTSTRNTTSWDFQPRPALSTPVSMTTTITTALAIPGRQKVNPAGRALTYAAYPTVARLRLQLCILVSQNRLCLCDWRQSSSG